MRVITLTPEKFTEACRALQSRVEEHFMPDAVVGIARGGVIVAENMFPLTPHAELSRQRPSTASKSRIPDFLLRMMPRALLDILRMAESLWLNRKKALPLADLSEISIPEGLEGRKRILVTDDAVDSGATLDAVIRALSSALPEAEIRSAAITVTTRHPLTRPDVALFDNQTLIRFPWSKDYRNR